jgi:hypothetical protein
MEAIKTQKKIVINSEKIKLRLVDPDRPLPEIIDESPRKLFDIESAKAIPKARCGVKTKKMKPIAFAYCNDKITVRIKKNLTPDMFQGSSFQLYADEGSMSVLIKFSSKDAVNARKVGTENPKSLDLGRVLVHLYFTQIPFLGITGTGTTVLAEKFAYDTDTIYVKFSPIVKQMRKVNDEEADD